ncbi:hypothetical protein [Actinoplanes sp. NPDC049118]|uniref:hypothetical protein n=1 Tax=Actinoplanes sp. NPDC049118 TaxID=3155769 RepID=UPI0033EF1871
MASAVHITTAVITAHTARLATTRSENLSAPMVVVLCRLGEHSMIKKGGRNARGGRLVPLVKHALVLALFGSAHTASVWVTPQILRLVCQATDCVPRAVAAAGWATIAAVPAAIACCAGSLCTGGWWHWLIIAMTALLAAPCGWLIPGRRDCDSSGRLRARAWSDTSAART